MGIAMCHFEIASQEMNQKGSWQIVQNATLQGGLEYIVSWIGATS